MTPAVVLSLCDASGVMVQPWLEAGYECWIVDRQHPPGETREANLVRVGADVTTWLPPRRTYAAAFAFPACTHLAVSGARWFVEKGLEGLVEALTLVEACRVRLDWTDAPWLLENPVSTLSSYWRAPDYTFQPWQYGDRYTKKTCLWTGHGFIMPPAWYASPPDGTTAAIHLMPPSADRGAKRSVTPAGFAQAVFEANHRRVEATA
jgi:hypothetical protein